MARLRNALELVLDDLAILALILIAFAVFAFDLLAWAIVGIAIYLAAKMVIFRSHLARPAIGSESMAGEIATAITDLTPEGQVKWKGEIWEARAEGRIPRGERVRVTSAASLVLEVEAAGAEVVDVPRRPASRLLTLLRGSE